MTYMYLGTCCRQLLSLVYTNQYVAGNNVVLGGKEINGGEEASWAKESVSCVSFVGHTSNITMAHGNGYTDSYFKQ